MRPFATAFAWMQQMQVIDEYTRATAIDDEALIDVSEPAKEAGLKHATAVTAAVWGKYIAVPPGVSGQDEAGRLWDILWMLRCAIARCNSQGPNLMYPLYVANLPDKPAELIELKANCGPGDEMEPVLTIMLPSED